MKKERFKLTPSVYLILIKENKILLLRRFNTSFMDGYYSLVAGHLDGGETFLGAIVREAKEEAGLIVKPGNLEVVHTMHRKVEDHERVDIFLTAKNWSGEPKIMEPNKCDDLRWFDLNNLPENTVPYVRQAIDKVRNKIFYSEYGW